MKLTHWMGVAVIAAAVTVLGVRLQQKQDVMTPLAERYIKLVLALGQHDPDYVDAYTGRTGSRRRRSPQNGRWPTSMPMRTRCARR